MLLKRVEPKDISRARVEVVDAETLRGAEALLAQVREGGEPALRALAERWDGLPSGAPLCLGREALGEAWEALDADARGVLERTAGRVERFARAQRAALRDVEVAIPGGAAGHTVRAVERAGCYAPGGRFPLPSSVLMTAVTAKAAGVERVWVASPKPSLATRAAAWIAGAEGLLCAGGAHAIGALAFGAGEVPRCDVVVGPGNRWVTAAKKLVAGYVGIDMLAGPSELLVLADDSADPEVIAADLLAQAEHDTDAAPLLVSLDPALLPKVEAALARQLADLPSAQTARAALQGQGFAVVAGSEAEAAALCDEIAPEHLQVMVRDPQAWASRLRHYGGLFIGAQSAEVLGDYGAGPNHTLPTSGTARRTGGLSVLHFVAVRTWLRMDEGDPSLTADAAALGRIEGLEAHARAAERRLK
jgi:phosphoribosyl-ATP pyrophosphohydrolase/phosphoribosyl-AMP cyclohydrolase/histidinol dehydrogenase